MNSLFHPNCRLHPDQLNKVHWNEIRGLKKIELHLARGKCRSVHPPLRDLVLETPIQGTTPLLMACRGRNLKTVERIVDRWGADVNQVGAYYRNNTIILGASPVFVAAAVGSEKIVRYLVRHGADVTQMTDSSSDCSGMTALHAAVSFLHSDCSASRCQHQQAIIHFLVENGTDPSTKTGDGKPIWMLSNYNSTSLRQLISLGMRLDQRTPNYNRSIAHYWARAAEIYDSVDILKLLASLGVDMNVTDRFGLSPLMVAAIGQKNVPNVPAMRYLMELPGTRLEDKIDALELAGSMMLGDDDKKAFDLWEEAIELRNNGKVPVKKIREVSFDRVAEWSTLEELEQAKQRTWEYNIQAFLVRLRILSRISSSSVRRFVWPLANTLRRHLYDLLDFSRTLDISWTLLEAARSFDPPDKDAWTIITTSWYNIVELLECPKASISLLNEKTLLMTLQLVVETDCPNMNRVMPVTYPVESSDCRESVTKPIRQMETVCRLINIIANRPDLNTRETMRCLYVLVKQNCRDNLGRSLLHNACTTGRIATLPTVALLQKAGADSNAVDDCGNTALHLLSEQDSGMLDSPVADLLVNAGCHEDQVNNAGCSAQEVSHHHDQQKTSVSRWQLNVPTLVCSSAKTLRQRFSPYKLHQLPPELKQSLPRALQDFLLNH